MPDLKLAIRTLAKTPFITGVAVLSLALGIGANAAIFSLFDQIILEPLPVQEPGRLVNLGAPAPKPGSQSCNQAGDCDDVFSYLMFRDLERESGAMALAAHRAFGANVAFGNQTSNGSGMLVSGGYFQVLGLTPTLGRLIGPDDDRNPGEHPVAVLSHRYWESSLGSDPEVVGRTITVNGNPLTVVGVAPQGFDGTTLGATPDVFVPLSMRGTAQPGWDDFDNRRSYWAYVFGRLAPGATVEQARAELNTLYGGIINEVELPLQSDGLTAETLERFAAKRLTFADGRRGQSSLHEDARTPLLLLLAVTGVVLLIACANIANLLLARAVQRTQEMAIRSSLGAGRRVLLRQLLTESVLLALLGGAASLVVAWWTLQLLGMILPPEAFQTLHLEIRPPVILFTGGVALGTGLLFGMYPAIHSTRPDLVTMLKASTGQPSGARAAARFRWGLVTAQIAMSMTLLVGAGLFLKSLLNVGRVDLGLDVENVVTFAVSPRLNGYEDDRARVLYGELEAELAALPGVTAVTASLVPILAGNNWGTDVSVQGYAWEPGMDANARFNRVGPGYFETMGIPLLAGREFSRADGPDDAQVAIVNQTFAQQFGLGRDAVGKWMSDNGSGNEELDMEIVGLVRDAKYSEVKGEVPPLFFTPWRQGGDAGFLTFYVRTAGDPATTVRAIPGVVKSLDPNLPVESLRSLRQQVRENIFLDRMISSLSAAFAGLATLLAAIGLYGVLAYTVGQRTREIGLRMALGAGKQQVRTMVLRQVFGMTLVGGLVGIGAALILGRYAGSLLFGLEGHDPWVITAVGLLLGVVALAAGYLPALRASRVEPMEALRYE